MINKNLYDAEGSQFYPITDTKAVLPSGVISGNNNLYDDLVAIWNKALAAYNQSSGATEVAGSLGVIITYTTSAHRDLSDMLQNNPSWDENMTLPSSSAPYAWKHTQYTWQVGSDAATIIANKYEICATALYPETLTMYTAIGNVSTTLGGPSSYENGSQDSNNSDVSWYTYFPGLNASSLAYGYIATRHRGAGEAWPNGGGWRTALFTQYPLAN